MVSISHGAIQDGCLGEAAHVVAFLFNAGMHVHMFFVRRNYSLSTGLGAP